MGDSLLDNENRPGQSSAAQAQDAGLVRILCAAREGAHDTSHEPPTADPDGGWCGVNGAEVGGALVAATGQRRAVQTGLQGFVAEGLRDLPVHTGYTSQRDGTYSAPPRRSHRRCMAKSQIT